ncbi:MAG: peptidoglycan-binding domain-containing protein [Chthoniobacterales bacterium]
MQKFIIGFVATALLLPRLACADEVTRQVQEELRRRHLFFSNIDGRNTPETSTAVRRYQERQGFPATGITDETTLHSLGITAEPAPPAEGNNDLLPDVPVLRSDDALPDGNRDTHPAPPPPPASSQPITRRDAADFIHRYVAAVESPNIHDELGLYSERVDYYDHGLVDRQYVQNELAVYDQRWPRRNYAILSGVRLEKSAGKQLAKFRLAFQVANSTANRAARGRIDETFGLVRSSDGNLQIVSLRERRVRRNSHGRRGPRTATSPTEDPVVRSMRRAFHSMFHH